MIHSFFKDRTGIVTSDTMYPPKIEHKSPQDLFSLFFTHGEYTSTTIDGNTFPMTTPDGCAFLSPCHNTFFAGSKTFSNLLISAPPLSCSNFAKACDALWNYFSIPDTIITGPILVMCQKATEVRRYYEIKRGWTLQHIICPQLKEEKQWRWFLADSTKATGHFKELDMDISEIGMFSWDWIVASLSMTQPTME